MVMTTCHPLATWTGVLLAGGQSSRMGQDKALLDWHGVPLIEHMHQLLEQAGAARVVVSGNRAGYASVEDETPDLGPLGGLLSVANTLPDGDLLILPIDMPRLPSTRLRQLMSASWRCATFDQHMLPMRLRLNDDSRTAIQQVAEAPQAQRSLRALQKALHVVQLALPLAHMHEFDNCNTPQEWQAMLG